MKMYATVMRERWDIEDEEASDELKDFGASAY